MKAQINAKSPFTNAEANQLYTHMSNNLDVIEHGIDSKGNVYFHWANGNTERFSRAEFIKKAHTYKTEISMMDERELSEIENPFK